MSCASWPAPLGMARVVRPSSRAERPMMERIRVSVGAGMLTFVSANEKVVPFARPILFASATIKSNSWWIFRPSRSRSSSERTTFPGITFGAPGSAEILPTVPTCRPGIDVTMRLTATVNRAAESIASRRLTIGVVPA